MKKIKSRLYRSYKCQFRFMRWNCYAMGAYPHYMKLYDGLHWIGWTYLI